MSRLGLTDHVLLLGSRRQRAAVGGTVGRIRRLGRPQHAARGQTATRLSCLERVSQRVLAMQRVCTNMLQAAGKGAWSARGSRWGGTRTASVICRHAKYAAPLGAGQMSKTHRPASVMRSFRPHPLPSIPIGNGCVARGCSDGHDCLA